MKKKQLILQNGNINKRKQITNGILLFLIVSSIGYAIYGKNSSNVIKDLSDWGDKQFDPNPSFSLDDYNCINNQEYINSSTIEDYASSGSGYVNDPYIITNLTFKDESKNCFQFENLSRYIVIKNLGINEIWNHTLFFINSRKITIENCIFSHGITSNRVPTIFLEDSRLIDIKNCTFLNCESVMQILHSGSMTIESLNLVYDRKLIDNKPKIIEIFDSEYVDMWNNAIITDLESLAEFNDDLIRLDNNRIFNISNNDFSILHSPVVCSGFDYVFINNNIPFLRLNYDYLNTPGISSQSGENYVISNNNISILSIDRGGNYVITNNNISILSINRGGNYLVENNHINSMSVNGVVNLDIINNNFEIAHRERDETSIYISNSQHILIEKNEMKLANIGIRCKNTYNFLIQNNKFIEMRFYVFYIDRYTSSFRYYGRFSGEKITENVILIAPQYIHNDIPSNVKIAWNLVCPHFSFLILIIFTTFWCVTYWPLFIKYTKNFFVNKKKIEQMENQVNFNQKSNKDDNFGRFLPEYVDNFKILHLRELTKFKEISFSIFSIVSLYISILLIQLDNNNLIFFPNYESSLKQIIFMSIEAFIIGLFVNYLIQNYMKTLKDRPKFYESYQKTLNLPIYKIIALFFGIITILFDALVMSYVRENQFRYILFAFSVILLIFCFTNIYLVNHGITRKIYIEFILICFILLYELFWISSSLDDEIFGQTSYYPDENGYWGFFKNRYGAHIVLIFAISIFGILLNKKDYSKYDNMWDSVNMAKLSQKLQGNPQKKKQNIKKEEKNKKSNKKEMSIEENNIENIQKIEFDEILKDPSRFKIIFLLYNYQHMNFTEMQKLLKVTSGNLMYHMKKLQEIKWVEDFMKISPKVLKYYKITSLGEDRFKIHIQNLENVLDLYKEKNE